MKAVALLVVLLAICAIECRKVVPINKNANIDFINMESGGGVRPAAPIRPPSPTAAPAKPQTPAPTKAPAVAPPKSPTYPAPAPAVTTKPVPVAVQTPTIAPSKIEPVKPLPNQMDLKPVPPKSGSTGGVTTPGYGSVKQLVTFYDSQGKASVIRPYSYADAVKKQG